MQTNIPKCVTLALLSGNEGNNNDIVNVLRMLSMLCGAVFIDLSAAYDTVWHRGLKLKLNNVIPDKSLVNFIMTMIASCSFIMHVGTDRSKQRFLKNGVPQGSVLAPLLFNLYTSDLPKTQSKKYIYADDIALMISGKTFGPIEQSLSEDLDNMSRYFNNWRLKINTGKTVCTSFHLAHRLAKYQLQITCEGQNNPHEDNPKYLGVTLDRTLTFKTHISKLSQKISARNNLLRRLAGLSWGANFKVLQTAAVCLVYAPAEYCAPAWSSSTHTAKIDIVLNTTMRIVSGCLKTTPTFYLPVVSGIIPPDIRRSTITLKLFNKANSDPAHMLHNACTRGSTIKPRLTSRTPFSKQCVLVNSSDNTDNPRTWPMDTWNSRWANLSTPLHRYISSPSTNPIGHDLHIHCWVRLNRMRTGYGRLGQQMVRMGLATDPSCSCGCAVQTAHHAIYDCPITRCPGDFTILDLRARDWLHTTQLNM